LGKKIKRLLTQKERKGKVLEQLFGEKENRCPYCERGIMVVVYS
jgi:DNA-directed RNA polymerase subunit RPC12/RpoP